MPEAADAERVFRDMVGQGNKLIFGTTFGYMEPMLKVARRLQGREVRARHRLQDGREHAHLRQPHLRGRLHGRRDRRRDDQDQHARRGRLDPDPRGDPQHQHASRWARRAVNPKVKTKVVWVNEWFNPPKETEAAHRR